MVSRGDDFVFGDIPPGVFKPGAFGSATPKTASSASAGLVQALPPSPSPSRCSPEDSRASGPGLSQPPRVLNPTYEPGPGESNSGEKQGRISSPLTPRTLQERRAELALKVDGVLRETNDAQSRLAAQDARLGFMQQGLQSDAAPPQQASSSAQPSRKLDQLRQHISDLRNVVTQDGSRVPGALQHVQRMLRLLAGQATAVDGDSGGREVMNSIEVLSREVSQLIELAAKGERTAGEVMTIRRTLEDLQQDVKTASRASSPSPAQVAGRSLLSGTHSSPVASSPPPGEIADLKAKVYAVAAECQRALGEAATARQEVSDLREFLQLGLSQTASMEPKPLDYSDELAACSSGPLTTATPKRPPNGEADAEASRAANSSIREQMQMLSLAFSGYDVRLKQLEEGLASMATRSETLLVSKELVQNLRQEIVRDVEDLRSKVQSTSSCSSLGQGESADVVRTGLRQLREAGELPDALSLSSIILASQGDKAPAALAAQVSELKAEVTRIAATNQNRSQQETEDAKNSKKDITRLFDDVNKMKEHLDLSDIDQRFQNLRKELQGAIAELRVKTPQTTLSQDQSPRALPSTASKSDFAALREGLNNLKLKHSVPQEITIRHVPNE